MADRTGEETSRDRGIPSPCRADNPRSAALLATSGRARVSTWNEAASFPTGLRVGTHAQNVLSQSPPLSARWLSQLQTCGVSWSLSCPATTAASSARPAVASLSCEPRLSHTCNRIAEFSACRPVPCWDLLVVLRSDTPQVLHSHLLGVWLFRRGFSGKIMVLQYWSPFFK